MTADHHFVATWLDGPARRLVVVGEIDRSQKRSQKLSRWRISSAVSSKMMRPERITYARSVTRSAWPTFCSNSSTALREA